MNRAQRRKATRTPMDAKTLKRIVDDAVENTKAVSLLLFKLALVKQGMDEGLSRDAVVKLLDDLEASINELQSDEAKRKEIVKFLETEEGE